ncbi:MAG: membrane protein insertion efficiency factor YidD [Bacteroidetes bacterium]|nr:membrane protein insertion efficiency factor YidD [Bacteroidota bacterium]
MRRLLSKQFVVCSFWFVVSSPLLAQPKLSDKDLLLKQNFYEQKFETKRKVSFLLARKKKPIIRYNPVSLTFGGLLFVYQKFLSAQISNNCPYNPSCSGFSKNSILRYGFVKGIALSADRLTRCNNLAAHDISFLDFKDGKIEDNPEKYRLKK